MGLKRILVGKTYPQKDYLVERELMLAYARATNEDNPRLASFEASMASPMFAVVWLLPAMLDFFFDQELMGDANIGRMLHGSQDMTFLAPVGPGDRLGTVGRVAGIEDRSTGELLTADFITTNQQGVEVMKATSGFFFRGPPDPNKLKKKDGPTPIPKVLLERKLHVDDDQTSRYAKASGDHNPIHLDEEMAKAMGFPRAIVHGLCVMAFAQKMIIDGALQGDPVRLRRLAVQFAKPVFPGDDLTCIAWRKGSEKNGERLEFVLKNQSGNEVIREGLAVLG